jgi:4-diphosphocytidyl-2-C-methyl-D-erythritol kinase
MIALRSYAKINWYLRVGGRRADGFHEIETVFQEIDLADDMEFDRRPEPGCEIAGMPFALAPQENLIWRAWQRLREECGTQVGGVHVRIRKRIPACGGLGGASSNAATTLRALNAMFGLGLSTAQLEEIGASLGSDVPFFVRGGCAIGRGRGEQLTPVADVRPFRIALLFPKEKIPTAEAYHRLSAMPRQVPQAGPDEVVAALQAGDAERLARAIHNDFELLVRHEKWFLRAVGTLEECGCRKAFLSGSGSTVVGLKNTLEDALSEDRSADNENQSSVWETFTRPQRDAAAV